MEMAGNDRSGNDERDRFIVIKICIHIKIEIVQIANIYAWHMCKMLSNNGINSAAPSNRKP